MQWQEMQNKIQPENLKVRYIEKKKNQLMYKDVVENQNTELVEITVVLVMSGHGKWCGFLEITFSYRTANSISVIIQQKEPHIF